MMKTRFLLSLTGFAIFLAGCASAGRSTSSPVAATEPPIVAPSTPTAAPAHESPTEAVAATEASGPAPLPVATSRGPDLHATDPATVSLASGGLQFVEFFRFT
jgi:hypothetical protein